MPHWPNPPAALSARGRNRRGGRGRRRSPLLPAGLDAPSGDVAPDVTGNPPLTAGTRPEGRAAAADSGLRAGFSFLDEVSPGILRSVLPAGLRS